MKRIPLWTWIIAMLVVTGIVLALYSYSNNRPKSITPTDISTGIILGNHQAVDLGLSVKWASCNIGGTNPWDYGYFYVGRPEGWILAPALRHSDKCLARDIPLDLSAGNWTGGWRLPLNTEEYELYNRCHWQWSNLHGVNGYKVTGPNGNSIFLPAAGYGFGSAMKKIGITGHYWAGRAKNLFTLEFIYFDSNSVLPVYCKEFYKGSARLVTP